MSKVSRDTARQEEKFSSGRLRGLQREVRELPEPGRKKVYLLTSAQNNTHLHRQCWTNLLALAKHDDAELIIGAFTYDKTGQNARGQKKGTIRKTAKEREKEEPKEWWDSEIEPYLNDQSIEIAPGLIWCGELNLLPTAVNPISGFESYTGRASAILPHAKFAMQSIASPKHSGTKFVYTTGTVTLRNYVQKKAGQKASFHHGYGALLVEVDSEGDWFVRQINADSEGVIYDLDRKVDCGIVTTGHRPEAIVWGDIHVDQLEPHMFDLAWGEEGIAATLSPKLQVFHDVLDFRSQNHHDRDDCWKSFKKFLNGRLSVLDEIHRAASFLAQASEFSERSIVVCSNHDMALVRWLKETDFKQDPQNAIFYLMAHLAAYRAMDQGDDDFYPVEWAMRNCDTEGDLSRVKFLRRDERYAICKDANGGIQIDMHGDKGANGAKGNLRSFARTGLKCVVADSHSAGIFEGAYQVGVMGSLDQGYNEGMSSWSHTNCIIYPNGKRTLFTIWNGKWRA